LAKWFLDYLNILPKKIKMNPFLSFLLLTLLFSCSTDKGDLTKWSAFTLKKMDNPGWHYAERSDPDGNIIESGYLLNGKKNGLWVEYHPNSQFPKVVANYVDGDFQGPFYEYNLQGQISQMANYNKNLLEGKWTTFRFSRPVIEANYVNGKLSGTYKEYDFRNGKIQKEANFVDGLEDGLFKFYNEEGKVTMEYHYKRGEQISGGIINQE
jgi:antitoxin component YwqK of YwqJK toxin-antitoxin module